MLFVVSINLSKLIPRLGIIAMSSFRIHKVIHKEANRIEVYFVKAQYVGAVSGLYRWLFHGFVISTIVKTELTKRF